MFPPVHGTGRPLKLDRLPVQISEQRGNYVRRKPSIKQETCTSHSSTQLIGLLQNHRLLIRVVVTSIVTHTPTYRIVFCSNQRRRLGKASEEETLPRSGLRVQGRTAGLEQEPTPMGLLSLLQRLSKRVNIQQNVSNVSCCLQQYPFREPTRPANVKPTAADLAALTYLPRESTRQTTRTDCYRAPLPGESTHGNIRLTAIGHLQEIQTYSK